MRHFYLFCVHQYQGIGEPGLNTKPWPAVVNPEEAPGVYWCHSLTNNACWSACPSRKIKVPWDQAHRCINENIESNNNEYCYFAIPVDGNERRMV